MQSTRASRSISANCKVHWPRHVNCSCLALEAHNSKFQNLTLPLFHRARGVNCRNQRSTTPHFQNSQLHNSTDPETHNSSIPHAQNPNPVANLNTQLFYKTLKHWSIQALAPVASSVENNHVVFSLTLYKSLAPKYAPYQSQ